MKPLHLRILALAAVVIIMVAAIAIYVGEDGDDQWWVHQKEGSPDLTVSSNVVLSSNGSEAHTADSFTNALRWAVRQEGKTVLVPAGRYVIENSLSIADGVTLLGAGNDDQGTVFNFTVASQKSARIELDNVNNVTLKRFQVTGNGNVEVHSNGVTVGRYLFEDITIYRTSPVQAGAFMAWTSNHGVIQDQAFIRCKAIETGCTGFILAGDRANSPSVTVEGGWVKNTYFEDCVATGCGYEKRYNPWVCGFDLAEGTNIRNLRLVGCEATNNWLDGFHFEDWPHIINAVLQDCSASDNSNKGPGLGSDFGWNRQLHDIKVYNTTS